MYVCKYVYMYACVCACVFVSSCEDNENYSESALSIKFSNDSSF